MGDLCKWSYPAFIWDFPHLLKGFTEEAPRSIYKAMKEVLNLMIENEQMLLGQRKWNNFRKGRRAKNIRSLPIQTIFGKQSDKDANQDRI